MAEQSQNPGPAPQGCILMLPPFAARRQGASLRARRRLRGKHLNLSSSTPFLRAKTDRDRQNVPLDIVFSARQTAPTMSVSALHKMERCVAMLALLVAAHSVVNAQSVARWS